MEELLLNLQEFLLAAWDLLTALLSVLLPWTPLAAWIAFWLFAVNWVSLRTVLSGGGWIGLVLIGLTAILVWGMIAPPSGGYHYLFGLTLSNFVGKTVYVTALIVIMLLCGSVQLSGALGSWYRFDEQAPESSSHATPAAHH